MGDESTPLTTNEVRHVMRRTGFGAPPKDLTKLLKAVGNAPTRGNVADELLGYKPKLYKPSAGDPYRALNKWVGYLVKPKSPLQSKLVLFWHDHFATQVSVVGDTKIMALQIRLLHEHAKGNFKALVKAINRDAAMMEMLDTVRNRKAVPNENYSRELQELFALGVDDLAGNPNYTQEDVSQIARAFTGWDYVRPKGTVSYLRESQHDYMADFPERGPKVVFQSTGGFGPGGRDFTVNGEGEAEIDTVTDILFDHKDTHGKSTVARRITRRLLRFFCHDDYASPGPAEIATIDQIIADSGFDTTWDLAALYRAIFVHDVFFETAASAPYGAATKKSVKWPVDYFVSTLRVTQTKLRTSERRIFGGSYDSAYGHLSQMGQVLLEPPSVFGWDWDTAWISSATLLARCRVARDIAAARYGSFFPEKLIDIDLTDPGDIVDAVTDSLGIPDQVTAAERQIYVDYLTDSGANPSIDLRDYDVRNTKLHGLYALVMQSPAFQLH